MGYERESVWRELQKFFPPEVRLQDGDLPEELYIYQEGIRIHIDRYEGDGRSGQVLLLHGAGGNGRLLSPIARMFQQGGFEVFSPDLPLYGHTEISREIRYEDWVGIGTALAKELRSEASPLFLMGLSVGGMLAYHIAERAEADGLIVTCLPDQNDPEVLKKIVRFPWMATAGKFLMKKMDGRIPLSLPMKWVSKMNRISNIPEMNRILLKDPRSSGVRVPVSFLRSMIEYRPKTSPEDFHRCPVLLAHPEEDRWTELSLSRRFFDRLGAEKNLVLLPGAGHFPIEDEGFRVLREECLRYLRKWGRKDD